MRSEWLGFVSHTPPFSTQAALGILTLIGGFSVRPARFTLTGWEAIVDIPASASPFEEEEVV